MRKTIVRIVTYIFLLAILAFAMLPLVYTIFASFKTNMEILTNPGSMFPKKFTFDNYITAWNSENFRVGPMVLNSTIYTLFNVVITILTSSMLISPSLCAERERLWGAFGVSIWVV